MELFHFLLAQANRLLSEIIFPPQETLDSVLRSICRAISTPIDSESHPLRALSSPVDISGCGEGSKRSQIENELAVAFPFPSDLETLSETLRSCSVHFVPPVETLVTGAYSIGAGIRLPLKSFASRTKHEKYTHAAQLDLLVVVPRNFYSKNDFLDYRYTRKRAFYLAAVASLLKCNHSLSSLITNLRFGLHRANPLHPILLFDLRDTCFQKSESAGVLRSTRMTVCVQLATEAGLFSEARLSSDACNLRRRRSASGNGGGGGGGSRSNDSLHASEPQSKAKRAKLEPMATHEQLQSPAPSSAAEEEEGQRAQSPLYNASLLADMQRVEEHAHLVRAADSYPQLRPALALLQLWLHASARPTRVHTNRLVRFTRSFSYILVQHVRASRPENMNTVLLAKAKSNGRICTAHSR